MPICCIKTYKSQKLYRILVIPCLIEDGEHVVLVVPPLEVEHLAGVRAGGGGGGGGQGGARGGHRAHAGLGGAGLSGAAAPDEFLMPVGSGDRDRRAPAPRGAPPPHRHQRHGAATLGCGPRLARDPGHVGTWGHAASPPCAGCSGAASPCCSCPVSVCALHRWLLAG